MYNVHFLCEYIQMCVTTQYEINQRTMTLTPHD